MVFDTYQRMRAKGESWAGTSHILHLYQPTIIFNKNIKPSGYGLDA